MDNKDNHKCWCKIDEIRIAEKINNLIDSLDVFFCRLMIAYK